MTENQYDGESISELATAIERLAKLGSSNPHFALTVSIASSPIAAAKTSDSGRIGKFLSSPLGSAFIALLFPTILGGFIANHFSSEQKKLQDKIEQIRSAEKNRAAIFTALAETVAKRRILVGLVYAALRDDAPINEINQRWADYQQAYMSSNSKYLQFNYDITKYIGARSAMPYIKFLNRSVYPSFARLDRCLTRSYRLRVSGKIWESKENSEKCVSDSNTKLHKNAGGGPNTIVSWSINSENQKLQSCYATIVNELSNSIYLQNMYENSRSDQKNISKSYIKYPKTSHRWRQRTGTTYYESLDNAPTIYAHGGVCATATDLTCQRALARPAVENLLKTACHGLEDEMYRISRPTH